MMASWASWERELETLLAGLKGSVISFLSVGFILFPFVYSLPKTMGAQRDWTKCLVAPRSHISLVVDKKTRPVCGWTVPTWTSSFSSLVPRVNQQHWTRTWTGVHP
ncbi:hypothetical protein BU24DRAFT_1973 [Aaosphaeria arxii CBS 175.79]|uniref:Uncharacterized protein n=1 Tax=Aaosphaeria arxii CBS 175.79 TaxID=1450172 RepID=A0A6A5Y5D1_9PLEO|nr:uncharacterized protein BU24DRAFT_1973 [Aaosphaeria arxii CBS 175.79]KAF2020479.1 hypothetical protein BU24DRAFT_1973 [Aaosphaeria arxii CBS 175.79]